MFQKNYVFFRIEYEVDNGTEDEEEIKKKAKNCPDEDAEIEVIKSPFTHAFFGPFHALH